MVQEGLLTSAQGERIGMFLDLERLGLARAYYTRSVLASRSREARRLGLAASDSGTDDLTADVGALTRAYSEAVAREVENTDSASAARGHPATTGAEASPGLD
jgi:hypothetical protein